MIVQDVYAFAAHRSYAFGLVARYGNSGYRKNHSGAAFQLKIRYVDEAHVHDHARPDRYDLRNTGIRQTTINQL